MSENKFTPRAEEVLRLSQEAAEDLGHGYVGSEHLLLGLIREEEGIAHRVLSEFGVTDEMVCSVLQRSVGKGVSGAAPSQGLTPRAKSVVELAVSEASRMGSSAIGTAHLLMGLLREGGNMGLRILRTIGVDPNKMYSAVLKKLNEIKLANKKDFASYLAKSTGQVIDPNSIFDCQVKRMHEYKRQHLNALNIAAQYLYLKENPNADFIPKTYIFGAKAAPGYYMAKQMIRMICKLGDLINNDPAVRDKLRVVYLEEYCVSLSEHLMPAAEVSEQISLAGTEASGTGNMKFMLNGAITLGTLDGANVEIADAAGKENELIFGMLTPEVNNLKQVGYHPNAFIMGDDVANSALNFLERGWNGENFHEVTENLRSSDPYMVMADFKDYRRAQADLQKLYADRETWARMSLKNIANSGIFSADRAVLDYARDIWYASPVPMGK